MNVFLTLYNVSYIILQGLSGTAAGFLTAVPLLLYYVKLFILGSTPRSLYNIRYTGRDVAWGTLWPSTTLLVVISKFPILQLLEVSSLIHKLIQLWPTPSFLQS